MFKSWVLLCFVALSCLVLSSRAAQFEFETQDKAKFIVEITTDERIQEARKILNGTEVENVHIMGRIKKTKASYNPSWDFIIDPDTVSFFLMAIEVCDANIGYLQENLDEACGAFLPGCYWCPWTSKLIREIE